MPDLRLPSLTRPSTLAILLAWLAPLAASPVARGAVRGAVRAAPTMQSGERIAAAIGIKAPAVPEGPQPGMGQQKRLHALTQQLVRLPTRSSSDDVGEILAGQHIVERNFTTLLLNLKRKRKWRVATNLAEWAYQQEPPLRLTTLQYNLLISACARSAPRRALAVFRQMQRRCRPPSPPARPPAAPAALGSPPATHHSRSGAVCDAVSFNSAISAASRAAGVEAALEIFDEMRACGVEPTTISFNSAIAACAKAGEWQRALVLFRAMEASGVERNTVTYTGAINACAEGMQLDKAMTLFTYMEVAGVPRNSVTYAVAINACTRNGQWALGLRLFEEMDAKGVVADTVPRHATLEPPRAAQSSALPLTTTSLTTPLLPPLYVRWCTTRQSRRARRGGRGSAGSSCSPRCRRRACGSPR